MRIASGDVTKTIYFVAVDSTDLVTRLVGYAAKMKVKRARNGGTAAYYTTPTIAAADTGMPGVYELLVDEDTAIDAGARTQAYVVDIRDTGNHMVRVTREIELYRDTGDIVDAVWASATRTLSSFIYDTGVAQTVWREQKSTYTDTGSLGFGVNAHYLSGDTGAADRLRLLADLLSATGQIQAGAIATGAITSAKFAAGAIDAAAIATGAIDADALAADAGTELGTAVWATTARTLTAFALDTGIAQTVWRESQSSYTDTGNFAHAQGRIQKVLGDTGAAHLDQGRFGVISDSGRQAAVLDTGKVAAAIWTSHATRTLTAFALDTGVRDTVWRASPSAYTSDTGSFGYAAGRIMAVRNDTGAAHLDQGRFGVLSDSGVAAAVLDTGKVASAVWTSHATRTLTAYPFLDTGVAETVWRYTDTDARMVNVRAIMNDTGAAQHLAQAFAEQSLLADTGLIVTRLDAIKAKTDSLTFTVAGQTDANIQYVNDVQIAGVGDTGTGNTWRPV